MMIKIIASIIISLFAVQVAVARIDAMELALLQPYQHKVQLRWENITAEKLWLKGVAPEYDSKWQVHVIRLEQAEQSVFYLPANESLRLYNPDRNLQPKDITVHLSNGSGLLSEIEMKTSVDGHSLVFSPQLSHPQIIHVSHMAKGTGIIELAAMVSRHHHLKHIAPYRNLTWMSDQWVWLSTKPLQIPQIYWQLQAQNKETVEIEGPVRIALKNRLRYETQAASLLQDYRIRYRLDDSAAIWLDFASEAESIRDIQVNMQKETLGREQLAYIEIPAGHHRLELMSDRNLYLQILQQREDDYLLPMLNQPSLSVQDVREQGLMTKQSLPKLNVLAQALVRDNNLQSSAVTGQQILQQAAMHRKDYPTALAAANKLLGQRTFYRDLLPAVKQSEGEQLNAYFVNKRLKSIRNPQHDSILSVQHHSAALKRLGHAYFNPVASGEAKDKYILQKRYAPTWLRIIIDKRQCQKRRFKIQMDQQPPQSFVISCADDVNPDDAFIQSISETALLQLQQQLKSSENATLSHLFAAHRKPAKLIPVGINEIVLSQQVRQFKVWIEDNETRPLNLAIQIRVAKPFQFSEQSYLARLQGLPKAQIFELFVTDMVAMQEMTSHNEQQLQNEWIPLKRLLNGLYRHFKSSVADQMPVKSIAEQSQLLKWQQQAQQAEDQQRWTEALSHWARVIEASSAQLRDRAQLSQAAILARLSENYLAQKLWRYLSLYAQEEIAEQAASQLLIHYRKQNDSAAIQMLAAARFIQRPNQKRLHLLIDALMLNKQYRFVLLLGLIDSKPPVEHMLKAAYQLQWWQTYQQLLMQLPQTRQWFWRGLQAQKNGDYQSALEHWKKSGPSHWLLQLQRGMAISSQLSESEHFSQVFKEWSQWYQMHPGDKVWRNADEYITDAFGTDQYYSLERDLYSRASRGTNQRPVYLKVMGPVKLSFKFRALHQRPNLPRDGWLQIKDNQQQFSYPFSNSRAITGLELIGDGDFLPGNLMTVEYQVGQGLHEIELSADKMPISVNISQQQAELPVTVLAPLQLDTFSYALLSAVNSKQKLNERVLVKSSTSMAIARQGLTFQAILELPNVEDVRQARIRMIQFLAVMEQEQENRMPLLFFAEQLYQQFQNDGIVKLMWNRISRYSQWQANNSIVSSAGIRFVDTQGWQPSIPTVSVRKALISQTNPGAHVVFGNQRLVLMMTNPVVRKVHVEIMLDDVVFLPDSPALLQYQIDDGKPQQLEITRSEGWKKLVLQIPVGLHQLRFSIVTPVANQFLKLHFQDDVADMSVSQEKSFFVSTRSEPLKFYVKGPALIRIDEWLDGKITSRLQSVADGWQLLSIAPDKKHPHSLLKVWQRIAVAEKKPVISRNVERTLSIVPVSTVQVETQSFTEIGMSKDDFKLDLQGFGTWSLGTEIVRRNNVEEDNSRGNPVHFQQFRVDHHYFDENNNNYWKTQGAVRIREHGNPSFGVKESVVLMPDQWPFTVNVEAKAMTQVVENDPEWMGQFKIALSQSAHLSPKTTVIPKLSWFGRYLSLRDSGKVFIDRSFKNDDLVGKVDQDIYTAYKSQHSTGLAASLLVSHEPWIDTRWLAKINAVSNEDMNFFNPDHFSSAVHWQQLFGSIDLDASYRINFYQKDLDRERSSKRQFTKLELNWQSWTKKKNRLQISGQYNYDIDNKAHLGMLSFSYHFGGGRGYRDYKPGEIGFRNIREWQRLDEYN